MAALQDINFQQYPLWEQSQTGLFYGYVLEKEKTKTKQKQKTGKTNEFIIQL